MQGGGVGPGRGTVLRRDEGGRQRLARSIAPRFAMEAHLGGLFGDEGVAAAEAEPDAFLLTAHDEGPKTENAAKDDWIARNGRERREVKGVWYNRHTANFLPSRTDLDCSPMKRRDSKGPRPGPARGVS